MKIFSQSHLLFTYRSERSVKQMASNYQTTYVTKHPLSCQINTVQVLVWIHGVVSFANRIPEICHESPPDLSLFKDKNMHMRPTFLQTMYFKNYPTPNILMDLIVFTIGVNKQKEINNWSINLSTSLHIQNCFTFLNTKKLKKSPFCTNLKQQTNSNRQIMSQTVIYTQKIKKKLKLYIQNEWKVNKNPNMTQKNKEKSN